MAELTVNRYLKDKAMDHIDHALGRPLDPLAKTFRNHFATRKNGARAAEMRASPYWKEARAWDDMACFCVTKQGRAALVAHLKEIKDPHKAYTVTFEGFDLAVVSTGSGKARYAAWLRISDCSPDLTFGEFQRASRVRRA